MNINMNISNVAMNDIRKQTGLNDAAAIRKVLKVGLTFLAIVNDPNCKLVIHEDDCQREIIAI